MSGRQAYRDPNVPDGETTVYRLALASGGQHAEVTSRVEHDGPDRYLLHMEVPHDELDVRAELAFARRDGLVTASSYQLEARNDGRLVSREEGYFEDTSHIQFGGKIAPYPKDLVPLLGGILALRGLDFSRGVSRRLNIWLAFSAYWQVDLKVEKRETISLPVGRIDAWRVKVRPSFAQISGLLDKIVGGLLPDFTLHFAVDDAHRMLRFTFPTGPFPWNPKGVVEAIKLD
ncbi:MAG: hypothetical protein QOH52_3862 [Pseudonocardiales bacterium]|nr:hypothetical protein [Pseudonocardiales bacterium]